MNQQELTQGYLWRSPDNPAAIALLVLVAKHLPCDRPPPPPGQARFACLLDVAGTVVDEVVVTTLAPGQWELACHGGQGIRRAVSQALHEHGLHPLSQDPAAEDAHFQALAQAQHPAAVQLLARGGYDPQAAWWPLAQRLPRLLLSGPSNAGKSTLLNAWCGSQRALASAQAGTTRDLIQAEAQCAGWRLQLVDSAGQRLSDDVLESAGQQLAREERTRVDLIIVCAPADQPPPAVAADELLLITKIDLAPGPEGASCWASEEHIGPEESERLLQQLGMAVLQRLGLPPMGSA